MSDSQPVGSLTDGERLLTFEIGRSVYALPIASILEVAEVSRVTCVPTLPADDGGVMNWSGEALPIISNRLLLSDSLAEEGETDDEIVEPIAGPRDLVSEHVVVVSDSAEGSARMGLPIDRVIGLADGPAVAPRAQGLVQERRPIDGRVVSVLDPHQLVARAERIIQQAAA